MSFGFNQESVNGGLAELVRQFCLLNHLIPPASCSQYNGTQRMPFMVWHDMLDAVNQQYQQPAMGLQIAELIEPAHVGIMAYLGLSCQNLGEALIRFERYHRLAYDCNAMEIHLTPNEVEIRWGVEAGKPGQLVDETAIALFKNIAQQLIAPASLQLSCIAFVNPDPGHLAQYEHYFGCPVQFEATHTRIVLPLSMLSLPVKRADQTLQHLLDHQAKALLLELPEHDLFDQALQQHITEAVQQGIIDIESIAAKMNYSTRSMQRELLARNYTFQQRLAQVRETLAKQYLKDHHLSLLDISLLLAYSEQSAFQRAFKQWTGQIPYQWRKNSTA